ncbi:MAG TPA: hypothetical protein VF297_19570 [Pyrinomonadaceae bacterium]
MNSTGQLIHRPEAATEGNGTKSQGEGMKGACFSAIVEHWAKARVDGPMQAIERYDNAAKLMATVGPTAHALLFAAYPLLRPQVKDAVVRMKGPEMILLILFALTTLLFLYCASRVCGRQPKVMTSGQESETALRINQVELSDILKGAIDSGLTATDLKKAVDGWGTEIDDIIDCKHYWLKRASGLFALSSFLIITLLVLIAAG